MRRSLRSRHGRPQVFEDDRLRLATVLRDDSRHGRAQAPEDSRKGFE